MKIAYLLSIIIVLTIGCKKQPKTPQITGTGNDTTDTTLIVPKIESFRNKYEGRYNVSIREVRDGSWAYGIYKDTFYNCVMTVTVPPQRFDTIVYWGPNGKTTYPAIIFEKEDGNAFKFYEETSSWTFGIDSTGLLIMKHQPFISNHRGFISKDSINFEMRDMYPKLTQTYKIVGSRL